jgi:cytochrome P450
MLEDETLRFYRNDARGFVAITRYDDAVEVLRDWSTFTSSRGVDYRSELLARPLRSVRLLSRGA